MSFWRAELLKCLARLKELEADLTGLQPLDADLTSWAAVVRAAGFDAFVAAPSSANFAALLTDESGTGVVPFLDANTYTPTVTASSGTFTSVTAISGSYRRVGPLIVFTAQCTLTTLGTASGNILISLPFTAGSGTWIGAGRVVVGSGAMLQWVISSGGTTAAVLNYNNTSAIVAGAQIIITGSYWV